MKQIMAIVSSSDASDVERALIDEGFYLTRLTSSGGFLKSGNCTFITAVEDNDVDRALDIIKRHCSRRRQLTSMMPALGSGAELSVAPPVEITVGGATAIVTDIDRFEKL